MYIGIKICLECIAYLFQHVLPSVASNTRTRESASSTSTSSSIQTRSGRTIAGICANRVPKTMSGIKMRWKIISILTHLSFFVGKQEYQVNSDIFN